MTIEQVRVTVSGAMDMAHVVDGWGAVPELTEETAARIAGAVSASRAPATRRVYASDWRRFRSWCDTNGHQALPAHPVTVAAYLVDAADTLTETGERAYSPASLNRWVSVIGHDHRTADLPNPCGEALVTSTLSGIRRDYASNGDRPRSPRAPLLVEDILAIVGTARQAVTGWAAEVYERRDCALLLMGFAGAFRRSDLVGLTCGDVTVHRLDGVHVRLRRSKTDQEGAGAVRALPFTASHASCPPCAYVRWAQVVAAYDTAGRPGPPAALTKTSSPLKIPHPRSKRRLQGRFADTGQRSSLKSSWSRWRCGRRGARWRRSGVRAQASR
ncbi:MULTISPECIES: integrase [Rhodococcus]|uniref:Integrase n=1 Tax=Rhodococcus oxybenzonivorans TaxID=1990687 RepID=A0AAE4UY57_9NOCA|nr:MULTISPECIES: integrase [Rhodococcus]MDV7241740.1 integrase [Rhodococcus oxybenzonivorans]MDV7264649.1 integrase [Rhodococcus oxybenzonivorans]MDV7273726.1 integrase [Rhodococcus oxybenzonivorans]MDV7334022.1 integrase [Rhodococcus oxybenzonivorans]MDV7343441.1 integrase [Rhodococcus oxybenzonivorans]